MALELWYWICLKLKTKKVRKRKGRMSSVEAALSGIQDCNILRRWLGHDMLSARIAIRIIFAICMRLPGALLPDAFNYVAGDTGNSMSQLDVLHRRRSLRSWWSLWLVEDARVTLFIRQSALPDFAATRLSLRDLHIHRMRSMVDYHHTFSSSVDKGGRLVALGSVYGWMLGSPSLLSRTGVAGSFCLILYHLDQLRAETCDTTSPIYANSITWAWGTDCEQSSWLLVLTVSFTSYSGRFRDGDGETRFMSCSLP